MSIGQYCWCFYVRGNSCLMITQLKQQWQYLTFCLLNWSSCTTQKDVTLDFKRFKKNKKLEKLKKYFYLTAGLDCSERVFHNKCLLWSISFKIYWVGTKVCSYFQ